MLAHSHSAVAPWTVVRADDKQLARLNIIKDLLGRLHYAGKDKRLLRPDPQIVFTYDVSFRKRPAREVIADTTKRLDMKTIQESR